MFPLALLFKDRKPQLGVEGCRAVKVLNAVRNELPAGASRYNRSFTGIGSESSGAGQ